jgi:hypothetical protein
MEVIIYNNTGSDLSIHDLGILMVADATIDVTHYAELDEIYESDDLKDLINSNSIVVLYNDLPLSIADALDHVTLQSKYTDSFDEQGEHSSGEHFEIISSPDIQTIPLAGIQLAINNVLDKTSDLFTVDTNGTVTSLVANKYLLYFKYCARNPDGNTSRSGSEAYVEVDKNDGNG